MVIHSRYNNITLKDLKDSCEFIRYLLDHLHEEVKQETTLQQELAILAQANTQQANLDAQILQFVYNLRQQHLQSDAKAYAMKKHKEDAQHDPIELAKQYVEKNTRKMYTSKVQEIFEGMLLSEVKCCNCNHVSQTVDAFYDLGISIPDTKQRETYKQYKKAQDKLENPTPTTPAPVDDEEAKLIIKNGDDATNTPATTTSTTTSTSTSTTTDTKTNDTTSSYSVGALGSKIMRGVLDGMGFVKNGICGCFQSFVNVFLEVDGGFLGMGGNNRVISFGDGINIKDCIAGFFLPEQLNNANKYKCEKCNSLQDATRQFHILKLPPVLCIHIKRFNYHTYWGSKIGDFVEFPTKGLCLDEFVKHIVPTQIRHEYDLISVVNHHGGYMAGHYTCFAKNNGTWYDCNDATVTPVTELLVRDSQAYVLFFERREGNNISTTPITISCVEPTTQSG